MHQAKQRQLGVAIVVSKWKKNKTSKEEKASKLQQTAWLLHFLSHSFLVGGEIVTAADPAAQPMKLIFNEFYITRCKHQHCGFLKYTQKEMNWGRK